jgi:hypothetical protein
MTLQLYSHRQRTCTHEVKRHLTKSSLLQLLRKPKQLLRAADTSLEIHLQTGYMQQVCGADGRRLFCFVCMAISCQQLQAWVIASVVDAERTDTRSEKYTAALHPCITQCS